jgi:hypothetical protein
MQNTSSSGDRMELSLDEKARQELYYAEFRKQYMAQIAAMQAQTALKSDDGGAGVIAEEKSQIQGLKRPRDDDATHGDVHMTIKSEEGSFPSRYSLLLVTLELTIVTSDVAPGLVVSSCVHI